MAASLKSFVSLTKPGIISGNLLSVMGGYFLGAQGGFKALNFLGATVGLSLVIACAAVLNNIFDRDIDGLMERTKNRALVKKVIRIRAAMIFGVLLGALGVVVLGFCTNLLSLMLALSGLFIYIVIYTLWLKRNSIHGTLLGGLSGAVPPVVGYCSATGRFDLAALLLVLALCFWQMPHAYAIAVCHADDFKRANLPLLPIMKSAGYSKISMLFYAILFFIVVMMFPLYDYTGRDYSVLVGLVSFSWVILIASGLWAKQDLIWARKVFIFSILVITIFSLSLFRGSVP